MGWHSYFKVFVASGFCFSLGVQEPAAARSHDPVIVGSVVQAGGTVETVDPVTRQVLLKTDDGRYVTMIAGPEVRNLRQIKPGDRVNARYERAIAVRLGAAGQTSLPERAVLSGRTAAPGKKPYGETNLLVSHSVKVVSVDKDMNTVSFAGPDGIVHVVAVRDPRMQSFIHTLKAGDTVDAVYREAAMVEVIPER